MTSYIGEWIKHIILLILLASFLDLILPNSSMRKYVKLVVGFLLILLILSPILELLKFDQERLLSSVEELLESEGRKTNAELEKRTDELKILQDKAMVEEVQDRWGQELAAEIEAQFDVAVADVQINIRNNGEQAELQSISVSLRQSIQQENTADEDDTPISVFEPADNKSKDSKAENNTDTNKVERIEPVEPVHVSVKQQDKAESGVVEPTAWQKKMQKEVLKFVQTEWNISVDKIHIAWSRR